jgi:hypothetical protein
MTVSMHPNIWLDFTRKEYLDSFVHDGGAAIKYPVPLDHTARELLLKNCQKLASDMGYVYVEISAAETKIHMVDELFYRIAQQLDWHQLTYRVLITLCEAEGYNIPDQVNGPFVDNLAKTNRIDRNTILMDLRRKLGDRVFKQQTLARDFRVAMTQLCLSQLTGGQDATVTERVVTDWLTGRNKAVSAVKPYHIFNRISRTNARYLFESVLHWIKFAGYPGTVILLDIARLAIAKNPHDEHLYYTTASLLDAYEVLRQFIDTTDRLTHCLFVVVPDSEFLNEDSMGRGLGRYEALKFRVFDEVRAQQHANPMTALVRVASKTLETERP